MKIPEVESCCRCASLRSGCLAIAIYEIVGGILTFIYILTQRTSSIGLDVTSCLVTAVEFGAAICLLQGIRQKNAKLMQIWLVVQLVAAIILAVLCFVVVILYAKLASTEVPAAELKDEQEKEMFLAAEGVALAIMEGILLRFMFLLLFKVLIMSYFMVVVRSFRQRTMEETLGNPAAGYEANAF